MLLFVLALDGLEYDFVKRWDLKGLEQSNYGKLEVPINSVLKVPISSQVWASFLTGDWDGSEKYGAFTYGVLWKDYLYKFLRFIRSLMPFGVGVMKRGVLKRITFVKQFPKFSDETFVELTGCSVVNVPYLNYDHYLFKLGNRFRCGDVSLFEAVNLGLKHYEDLKRLILGGDLNSSNFTFAYVPFPDFIQHYCYIAHHKILWHYLDLQQFVRKLKEKVDGKFLIVSDHGFSFESNTHSCHGFYSSNFPLKVSKITDFYKLFVEEFGVS